MTGRRALAVFSLVFGVVACDQSTKSLATAYLRDRAPTVFLHGTVKLLYARNAGAFGSLGASWPASLRLIAFIVLPVLVLGAVLVHLLRGPDLGSLRSVGMALIVAGGVGNLIDRVHDHSVVDFMWFGIGRIGTNVFNVADVALMVGIGLLLP